MHYPRVTRNQQIMVQFKYTVKELPASSIWEDFKVNLSLFFGKNTEWLVFDPKVLEAQVIKSGNSLLTLYKTLRDASSAHDVTPALVFLLSGNVLRLTSVPAAPPVKPLESGLVYGIELYKDVNLQDPDVHEALTNAIKIFVDEKGASSLFVRPEGEAEANNVR
jgi:hypothetical protein